MPRTAPLCLLEDPRAKGGNGAGDIWSTPVNKRVPIPGFMGIFATENRDEELRIYDSSGISSGGLS